MTSNEQQFVEFIFRKRLGNRQEITWLRQKFCVLSKTSHLDAQQLYSYWRIRIQNPTQFFFYNVSLVYLDIRDSILKINTKNIESHLNNSPTNINSSLKLQFYAFTYVILYYKLLSLYFLIYNMVPNVTIWNRRTARRKFRTEKKNVRTRVTVEITRFSPERFSLECFWSE